MTMHSLKVAQHLSQAQACLDREEYRGAIGEAQEALRLSMDHPEAQARAYHLMGQVFLRLGRPAASTVAWFERSGELFALSQHPAEARAAYQQVLQLDPEHAKANKMIDRSFAQARAALASLDVPPMPFGLLEALELRGDFVGALREVDRLLEDHPDDRALLQCRGRCLVALERHSEAEQNQRRIQQAG